jgi:DNA-directed RNA polymerase subunit RPC12/RpoP
MDERNDTPNTASNASENAGLSPFYGTAKDVVARYTHCALCGANLHFTHVTDFSRNLTQETARCPECGVKARQAMHRLQ